MPLKELNLNIAGTATKIGPNDWDLAMKTLNGKPNQTPLAMKNNFTFSGGFCRFINDSNGKVIAIGSNVHSLDATYNLPQPLTTGSTDTLVTNSTVATLTNKTIDTGSNSITGIQKMPSGGKTGFIMCGWATGGSTGQGLLSGFIDMPTTPIRGAAFSAGTHWRYNTGSTANVPTGIKMGGALSPKDFLPRLRVKTRVVSSALLSTSRQYVGFSSNPNIAADGTPLPASTSGLLVGWRGNDTNITVFTNSGTASTTSTQSVNATSFAKTVNMRTYDIAFVKDPTTNNIIGQVKMWDENGTQLGSTLTFPSNLPPTGELMAPSIHYSNSSATASDYDIFFCESEQIK